MMILPTLQEQNSGLRARLGSGKDGLNILLGGSVQEELTSNTFGGAGAIGPTAALAVAYKDVRMKQVASGGIVTAGKGTADPWKGTERVDRFL